MNKNVRIATILNNIALEFQQITKILLEIEHVQSGPIPKGTVMVPVTNPNFPKVALSSVSNLSDGDRRTAAVNENVSAMVAEMKDEEALTKNPDSWDSKLVKEIFRNKATIFYKRVKGVHRGTILTVNRKDKTITDHKYLVTKPLNGQLCLVSKDQDGLDYVKNYVRPSIKIRVEKWNKGKRNTISPKLVRFYRPGDQRYSPIDDKRYPAKNHAAVYLSDRMYAE